MRNYPIRLLLFCVAAGIMSMQSIAAENQRTQYLDELAPAFAHTQGWGNLGVNTAAYATGMTPMALRIADKEYERGVGHHAPGEIVLPLNGNYLSFTAEVGVQWQAGNLGSVVFEVWVDGEKRFERGVMTDSDAAIPVEVDLRDAQELRLVASDAGDGISCDMANWADALLIYDSCLPSIGTPVFSLNGLPLEEPVEMEGNYALIGDDNGAQFAFNRHLGSFVVALNEGDRAHISIPLTNVLCPFEAQVNCACVGNPLITVALKSGAFSYALVGKRKSIALNVKGNGQTNADLLQLSVTALTEGAFVRVPRFLLKTGERMMEAGILPPQAPTTTLNTPKDVDALTSWRPYWDLGRELIVWDWLMQDGIGAGQTRNTYKSATILTFERINALLTEFHKIGRTVPDYLEHWRQERHKRYARLLLSTTDDDAPEWEQLWFEAHQLRRNLLFAKEKPGRILFVKQAPGVFSHQLTQYYGRYARPGGGLFVLDRYGDVTRTRQLGKGLLPEGSYMHPEITHDGKRILFSFCPTDAPPEDRFNGDWSRHYHIYEMDIEGTYVRQLTYGDYDDFSPAELPNGEIMFISTRRGGWHRCGGIGCPVYTLTLMNGRGGNIRTVSDHETQEWDPSVLNDGRVIYTRWDYVDRHAIHYQQLWTVHPDGTGPVAFYGNHTLNPVGVWEARAVPGSQKVMATAAPHHGMTAGSIILIDPNVGIDGLEPITRLTPDAHFPESEDVLLPAWRSAAPCDPPERTPEMERWPMQCYRSPWPLSEDVFLAAYSFDPLMGEPNPNLANMFGLYLVDAHGNKELLYRDLNISSLWPIPLRSREPAPALPSTLPDGAPDMGTYYLQDVYQSLQEWPEDTRITGLRIVQVLPKSTPVAHNPPVGLAFASPGKQVLGTVPVEKDGSAYFRVPSGLPLSFQALDATGQAVQIMRSITYLQPGENMSCVGCHEPRQGAPVAAAEKALALRRPPSEITPGPDGSRPFSYPILVQPVLDRHCVRCHSGDDAKGPEGQEPIRLTGQIEGQFTESYNTLAPRVAFAAWGKGNSLADNSEPMTQPGFLGAKGSGLMHHLLAGHQDVELDADDMERLVTWMDTNGLFYGTFNFDDQKRQQVGEAIAGPEIE